MAAKGTIERTRDALRSPDFRRLFLVRLASQFADGLFQVSLIASVVFSPDKQSTTIGLFKATLVIALPYSVIGPFTGVFIDRWRRRRILVVAPWVKTGLVWLVLFDPVRAPVLFFSGALLVISANRFFLATAQAVVPRLVPTEDLLMANSLATVGGTVALLAGVYLGGQISDAFGNTATVIGAGALWLVGSWLASRIRNDLAPHTIREDPSLLRHELRRVGAEFVDGIERLFRTPRAIGPITSISLDQLGQGLVLTLSLVVFRERFGEGVGSFSNLIGAGGIGVLLGILTVGALEDRFSKERIVAGAFFLGGLVILAVSFAITGTTVLLASFAVGLTFAWKKIPIDTMVQESIPDRFRGRIFSLYDLAFSGARVLAALLAVVLVPRLSTGQLLAVVGAGYVVWTPVLPAWAARPQRIAIRFLSGGRADETPRSVVIGGEVEPVEVLGRRLEDGGSGPAPGFRLRTPDGIIDVRREPGGDRWTVERAYDVGDRQPGEVAT